MTDAEVTIDNLIMCPICYGVMKNAVQCHEGHAFCEDCISQWMKTHQTCPISRKTLRPDQLYPNRAVRNIVDSMDALKSSHIICPCTKCNENIPLSSHKSHRLICPNEIIDCPMYASNLKCTSSCVGRYLRKDLVTHKQSPEYMTLELERMTSTISSLESELAQSKRSNLQQAIIISELSANLRILEKRVIDIEERGRENGDERPLKRARSSNSDAESPHQSFPTTTLSREEKEAIRQMTAQYKEIKESNPTIVAKEYLFGGLQTRYGSTRAIEITSYMQFLARFRRDSSSVSLPSISSLPSLVR